MAVPGKNNSGKQIRILQIRRSQHRVPTQQRAVIKELQVQRAVQRVTQQKGKTGSYKTQEQEACPYHYSDGSGGRNCICRDHNNDHESQIFQGGED